MKEVLYGGSLPRGGTTTNTYIEKEQLQNERRNLKLEVNQCRAENLRLKTRLQTMQADMAKKDKDIELLTIKLSNLATGGTAVTTNQVQYSLMLG
jgi:chromosome segregation ATPase